jgi:hypothetical protein
VTNIAGLLTTHKMQVVEKMNIINALKPVEEVITLPLSPILVTNHSHSEVFDAAARGRRVCSL